MLYVYIRKMQCSVPIESWNFGAELLKFKPWLCHFHLYLIGVYEPIHMFFIKRCSETESICTDPALTKLRLLSNSCGFPMPQDLSVWLCHGGLSFKPACSFHSNSWDGKLGKISLALELSLHKTDPTTLPLYMLCKG